MIAFANIIGIFLIIMFPLWSRKEEKSWLRKLDLYAAPFTVVTIAYIDIAYFMRFYPPYHMTMVMIVCLLLYCLFYEDDIKNEFIKYFVSK